ncbi:threonine/serine exporter family protein (plasmid) [Mesorhizobium sp. ISC25]|uniref:threonine/serine exporter family protein n=1 Tax=Mesorhizobium sp. ISC25 TaxID=3077335 RepID=UPI0035D81FAA
MTSPIAPLPPDGASTTREVALDTIALAAALLFEHGQTTEQTVIAAERLGHALSVEVRVLPEWGEIAVEIDGAPLSQIAPATPLGVDLGKVLAVMTLVDQVCDRRLPLEAVRAALSAVRILPSGSTLRFVLFAAIGAASMGVIFGALDVVSLLLIAASAVAGALARRKLATLSRNPFIQPLCAAAIAGIVAAAADRLQLSDAQSLVALCPCMILVPGPHLLNGAIDLTRTRIALGSARLVYAGVIVLTICVGLFAGLAAGGATLQGAASSLPVPLAADVVAAGSAVAAFATFFSMPWRLLPFPVVVGMLAHGARWAVISAGFHVATAALVASVLVGLVVAPVANRLRLPFAALGFSSVVSMMPGFFLFHAAEDLVQLVSSGPHASANQLASCVVNGATAFLIILAMTVGLIVPRTLLGHFLLPTTSGTSGQYPR